MKVAAIALVLAGVAVVYFAIHAAPAPNTVPNGGMVTPAPGGDLGSAVADFIASLPGGITPDSHLNGLQLALLAGPVTAAFGLAGWHAFANVVNSGGTAGEAVAAAQAASQGAAA